MTQRYPGFPTPTGDPKQHKEMLRALREAAEIAMRVRGDPMKSFVRLEELVTLGLADANGNLITSTSSGATSDEDQLFAFFQGE